MGVVGVGIACYVDVCVVDVRADDGVGVAIVVRFNYTGVDRVYVIVVVV